MTPYPMLLTVSRPPWLRLWQALGEASKAMLAAWTDASARTLDRRSRQIERAAVGHLSPHLLRDIGAGGDVLAEAQQRDALRAMRLDLHRF